MTDQGKCKSGCVPILDEKPKNLQKEICYAVECKNCGYHIIFWIQQGRAKPQFTDFVMLGEQKPLNLPLVIDPSFLEYAKKYRHLYQIPKVIPEASYEEKMNVLYEMVADGDIDIDRFNNESLRLLINNGSNNPAAFN